MDCLAIQSGCERKREKQCARPQTPRTKHCTVKSTMLKAEKIFLFIYKRMREEIDIKFYICR